MQTTNRKANMSRIRLNQEYRNKIANRMRVHLEQEITQEKEKYLQAREEMKPLQDITSVSYTHLTLPTILRV